MFFFGNKKKQDFKLEHGTRVVVPHTAIGTMFTSKHSDRFPMTPNVLLLTRRRNGTAEFANPKNSGEKRTWGCHLFVPKDVQAGDVLEIEWAEKDKTGTKGTYSACARLVSKGG